MGVDQTHQVGLRKLVSTSDEGLDGYNAFSDVEFECAVRENHLVLIVLVLSDEAGTGCCDVAVMEAFRLADPCELMLSNLESTTTEPRGCFCRDCILCMPSWFNSTCASIMSIDSRRLAHMFHSTWVVVAILELKQGQTWRPMTMTMSWLSVDWPQPFLTPLHGHTCPRTAIAGEHSYPKKIPSI